MKLRRQTVNKEAQILVNGLFADNVVVIQNENIRVNRRMGFLCDFIDQGDQNSSDGRFLGRLKQPLGIFSDLWHCRSDGSDEVGPELRRIVVTFIQGNPANGQFVHAKTLDQERSLAKTCRRRDKRELALQTSPQAFNQVRAWHQRRPKVRNAQFGAQDLFRYDSPPARENRKPILPYNLGSIRDPQPSRDRIPALDLPGLQCEDDYWQRQ